MKNIKSKVSFIALCITAMLILSACQVNFNTNLNKDGSGTYIQEIGFQGDEASMSGFSTGDDSFCASQNDTLPPGTTTSQETRNDNETWCIYETPFTSLEDLKSIYSLTDTLINDISLMDGTLTYDISLDLTGDSGAPMGADINWIVTMPGTIIENNASEQVDNTLTWSLMGGSVNDIRAVSELGGVTLGGDTLKYVLGGGAFLCLCCILPLLIAGVAFILIRKKKATAKPETPAGTPSPEN